MSDAHLPPHYAAIIRALHGGIRPRASAPSPTRAVDRAIYSYAVTRAAIRQDDLRPGLPDYNSKLTPQVLTLADASLPLPASRGSDFAVAAWSALTQYVAAVAIDAPDHFPAAERAFTTLAAAQLPNGTFLSPTASDNLETLWYHELVLLHAFTTYALLARSEPLLAAARRAALYHLYETQPDHATTQPWALNAFLLSPDTYPLADQILHTLQTQNPGDLDPISTNLLADTLAGGMNPKDRIPFSTSPD